MTTQASTKIFQFTNEQILARARSCPGDLVKYRLKYPNGGSDPSKPKPYGVLEVGETKIDVCDCIGFALWATGIARRFTGNATIPPFPDTPSITGSYINCSSLVEEARGFKRRQGQAPYVGGRFFTIIEKPVPGCLIVFPGESVRKGNPPHGHIGIVSSVPTKAPPPSMYPPTGVDWYIEADTRNKPAGLRVIHCSSSNYKVTGKAVRETHAVPWRGRGAIFAKLNPELFTRGVA